MLENSCCGSFIIHFVFTASFDISFFLLELPEMNSEYLAYVEPILMLTLYLIMQLMHSFEDQTHLIGICLVNQGIQTLSLASPVCLM